VNRFIHLFPADLLYIRIKIRVILPDVIFHGRIVITEHGIDHLINFEDLPDGIEVFVFNFRKETVAFPVIHHQDIFHKIFLVGKIFVEGLLGNAELFCHIIHCHALNSVTMVKPSYLFKNP